MPLVALAVVAAVSLCMAAPSALPSWAGMLVLPGLSAFYAVVTKASRPYRWAYLIALAYYLFFSWSLRHVTWAGYVAIALLGPFYELLPVVWLRFCGRRFPRSLAFACGIAAGQWCRAHMPEINYPHGQWAHALYHWPSLLGPVSWGGEVLANGLLAWIAAATVDLWRSWRLADPPWAGSCRALAVPIALWGGACCWSPPRPMSVAGTVDIAIVEPGDGEAFRFDYERYTKRFAEMLLLPTRQIATSEAGHGLDLVLWPESAVTFLSLRVAPLRWNRGALTLAQLGLPASTRVLLGSNLLEAEQNYAAAVLCDHRGRLIDWQEKHRPVPAGERMPFLHLLPDDLEVVLREWAASVVGNLVGLQPGRMRPPLETAGGIAFSALLCYDNAFDAVSRAEVAQGARFLAVLSNEAWYLGGAELDQMVAMSVFRALETSTPVIRCTANGASLVVDSGGRIIASLPRRGAVDTDPRILRQTVALGPGGLGAMAWVHSALPVLLLIAALPLVLARRKSWVRILRRQA